MWNQLKTTEMKRPHGNIFHEQFVYDDDSHKDDY